MAHRRYSDDERANAIAATAANGGNVALTATQLGIPAKTLENWAKQIVHPEAAKNGEQKKGEMADALEAVAWQLVNALPDKIAAAPLAQTATSLGVCIDKMRLLREQATQIKQEKELTDDERYAQLCQLAERIRQRRLAESLAGRALDRPTTDRPQIIVVAPAGTTDPSLLQPGR